MQKICLIIPCFNEALRLNKKEFEVFFKNNEFHVCFVNDGSNDNTLLVLEEIQKNIGEKCNIINLTKNLGKAEAIRQGVLNNQEKDFDYIGFLDADLSVPLEEINYFLRFCEEELKHDIIMGSRLIRLGAEIYRKPLRHYIGRVFATMTSILLNLKVYDTQCGAKLFSKKIYHVVFQDKFISKWIFDVEIIFRSIKCFGIDYIKTNTLEIPLNKWTEIKNSRIKFFDFLKAPFELLKIWYYYKK